MSSRSLPHAHLYLGFELTCILSYCTTQCPMQPFGPVLPIVRVRSVEQAVEHVNANRLALQVCIPHRMKANILMLITI